jgi:hypothetical protein
MYVSVLATHAGCDTDASLIPALTTDESTVLSFGGYCKWLSKTLPRVGAVALYTVLRTVVAKYMKWPFSAPQRIKTP